MTSREVYYISLGLIVLGFSARILYLDIPISRQFGFFIAVGVIVAVLVFMVEMLAGVWPFWASILDGPFISPKPEPPPPPPPPAEEYLESVFNEYGARCRAEGKETVRGELREKLKDIITLNRPTFAVDLLMVFSYYPATQHDNPLATVPLYEAIDAKRAVAHLVGIIFSTTEFPDTQKVLNTNRYVLSKKLLPARQFEDGERVTADKFNGTNKETVDLYLQDTVLQELFYTTQPFGFTDETRFRHGYLVGHQGSGKTTFLSGMIHADLDRVARNECSVMVMDSQNEMLKDLPRLKRFAEGGDLEGKLIYLEASVEHPPALNIFDVRRKNLSTEDHQLVVRGASDLVEFFISSGLNAETSSNMKIVLAYLVPAVMEIPDATITTLRELLEPEGYAQYQQHFTTLDTEVQTWLRTRLTNPGPLKMTFDAIKTKIDGFSADPLFRAVFRHPRSKLDLFTELQSAKVVIVNTMGARFKNATEPFGRFFIAKLFQATEERMFLAKGTRLPTFFYIDEASDYISQEHRIVDIINKARKQNVGLFVSQQSETDVMSDTVKAALRRCAIQVKTTHPGTAELTVDGKPTLIAVKDTNFAHLPHMDDSEWQAMQAEMRSRYCASSPPPPPAQERKVQTW